jgi:hypothetical protein
MAAAITTMDAKRSSGADFGSLAWGRFEVDATNFGRVVDLRAYLTATAPGGKYNPGTANPGDANQAAPNSNSASNPGIPLTLGGMYLGNLVTTRPDFFKPDVASKTHALLGSDQSFDSQPSEILRGRCSCGEVSFTVPNALDYAFYCHCSRCRVRTGSAFAAIGGVSIDKLQVTAGNEYLLIEGECSDGYGARSRSRQTIRARQSGGTRWHTEPVTGSSHLRRLQGAVVSDHRRTASIRRATVIDGRAHAACWLTALS